jgi:hypothetical protein
MTTISAVPRNPFPRRFAVASILLAVTSFLPAAALADPSRNSLDDVSYGDIPPATFSGEAIAPSTGNTAEPSYDDVAYGPHGAFSLDVQPPDEALAVGSYDDVTYPRTVLRSGDVARPEQLVAAGEVVTVDGAAIVLHRAKDPDLRLGVDGKTLVAMDGRRASLADLREGTDVRASYREQRGAATAIKIEASSGSSTR